MLKCKNLCLEYPDGDTNKVILNNINLDINENENIVLVGPSGSGKSSLIYLLSCLRKPTNGEIFFNDTNLSLLQSDELADFRRKHFAFIFQMHFLLPYLTIIENVLVAKNDYSDKSKQQASELLFNLGLEKQINKKIYQMSGGERQRVAVARALITDPDIIFADEPTASLDHNTAVEVIVLLKNHKAKSTLVMATHDTSLLTGDEIILKLENTNVSKISL